MSQVIAIGTNAAKVEGHEIYPIKQAIINATTLGDNQIVEAVTGKKIRVLNRWYRSSGSVILTWKSGTGIGSTIISASDTLLQGYGVSDNWAPCGWFFETKVGEALNASLSGNVSVTGELNYIEVGV